MNRPALLAASFAAGAALGWAGRSERQRRLRPSPSGAQKLAAAVAADGSSAWTWAALRRILASAEPGDAADRITVMFTGKDGRYALHDADVPDAPEGLEGRG